MNPFVEEEVGQVSQQKRSRVLGGLKPPQDVIGRMMSVFRKTFGQSADVYQVVRLKNEKAWSQYAFLVHGHIQQVELGVRPKQAAGRGKFFVDLRHVVSHFEGRVAQAFHRPHIQETLIRMEKADPHAADLPLGRRSHDIGGVGARQQPVQLVRNVLASQPFHKESQGLDIAQQLFPCRLQMAVHHLVSRQAERMQAVFLPDGQSDSGSHETDACGQVGHLQAPVFHLCPAKTLQQVAAQLTVDSGIGDNIRLASLEKKAIAFLGDFRQVFFHMCVCTNKTDL